MIEPDVYAEILLVPPRAMASVPVVSESATPREEVANATTLPVLPVLLPRIELAAMVASLVSATPFAARSTVELDPPTRAPRELAPEKAEENAREEVPTPVSAFVPFPYNSC